MLVSCPNQSRWNCPFELRFTNTGDYHVIFISRHPDDNYLCDDTARCWPLWHEYKNDENNVPLYGARIPFDPKRKLYSSKCILWTDSVHLTDSSCYLHGPFNFDSHSDVIITKYHITLTHWEYLLTICHAFSIVPPILSTLTTVKSSTKKRKKRTYPQLYYYTLIHTSYDNIVINSDVRYWLVSFPEEISCKVPKLVDIVLNSDLMYWLISFPKEVPSNFLKCYN